MNKADDSPLKGRRIINTRPAGQGDSLMASLARDGADPVALPMLRIETVLRDEALSQAVAAHADAALWVFTSVNAVAPFADLPQPIRWPPRVAAIGRTTAAKLGALGVNAWTPADGSRSEDLLADPRLGDVSGVQITLIGGEGGRGLLADTLRERGARVDTVAVYRRVAETPAASALTSALQSAEVVLFTSAEAMSAWHASMRAADRPLDGPDAPRWLVISPRLADHAKSLGYSDVPLMAAGPFDADLIAALHSHFGAVSSMSEPSSKPAEPQSVPAAPAPAAAAKPSPAATAPRRGGRGAGVAIFLALLAVLISAAGVAAGYWAWMELDTARTLLVNDSERTQRMAGDVVRQQREAVEIAQQVGDQTAALQLRMEGYDEAFGQLKDSIDLGRSQITLTTVEQLLLLANERLQLASDIQGADAALERADDRLQQLADPRVHGVRQAISRERTALAALPRFDREGVALAVSSLIEQIDALPLAPSVREAPEMDLAAVDLDGERPMLDRLTDILGQLFVLRREGGETIGALPESAAASTLMLLHIKLENARAAWLAGDVAEFIRILGSAQQWLARHFAVDQPAVAAFEAELQRLQRQPEMVEMPDVTRSLTLLRAQLEPGGAMIMLVMLLLAALAVGAVAAYLLGVDAGYVLFTWQGWVLESTLAGFAVLLFAVWLILWLLSRITGGALQLPSSLRGWFHERRTSKAQQNFVRGLRELVTGEPRVAEQSLLRGIADHEAPDLSYVAAARAAQIQGAYDRRDAYLDRAMALENPPLESVMAERIRLLVASGEPQRALDAARHFHGQNPKSRVALLLLAESLARVGEHRELYALMAGPGKVLTLDSRFPLTVKAFTMLLSRAAAAGELAVVKSLWDEAKSEICADPGVQRAYALALARLNAESDAVAVINRALKARWDAELVRCFGALENIDPVGQLASIEQWLQRYGEETELLIAAGLTCARNRLWGKAGSYLEAAAASHGTPTVYWHLGQLAERNQKVDEALAHYRRGLEMAAKGP